VAELATGMKYFDIQSQQCLSSQAVFEPGPGGQERLAALGPQEQILQGFFRPAT
jgi:hypothetical protein